MKVSGQVLGNCKLCGEYRKLTFEHVPPKKAFNNSRVHVLEGEDAIKTMSDGRMPWELLGIKYKHQQKGKGGYYLCEECNNKTGSWYANDYIQFVQSIWNAIRCEDITNVNVVEFKSKELYPSRIFKEMMVMFCDINGFGDDSLKQYLLSPTSTSIDIKKYRIFVYLVREGSLEKSNGLQVICNIETGRYIQVSEITSFPVGIALYLELPEDYQPKGCEFSACAKIDYYKKCSMKFSLPILEANTMFNSDYRSKTEIQKLMITGE